MTVFSACLERDARAAAARLSSYALAALFALGVGLAFALGPRFESGEANPADAFAAAVWLAAALAPAVPAIAWGGDARRGLSEVWAALPISDPVFVLARFAASYLVVLSWGVAVLGVLVTLSRWGPMDAGVATAAALMLALAAGAYVALATAAAAFARGPLSAYAGGAGACLSLTAIGAPGAREAGALLLGEGAAAWLHAASAWARLEASRLGVVTLVDMVYFCSLIAVGLALAVLALAARRERLA